MMARNTDISHINERRLRPIYDCLDNGNNKKALQEAEKVLKKQKDLHCAKVLKALALIRMARHEDSLRILQEVHSNSPTDDSTLQAMTICYRELHKTELIAEAYENAIKKEPNNEELHSHLFMAFVRMSDYKKQQLSALTLYRLKPKNPYYFWAVMSILMQAMNSNDSNIAQKITLPLAEKMCQKFLDENKIEAEAEVELFLMILEKQKKYKEMLTLMDSPIGAKLNNYLGFLSKKRADILRLVDRHEEAFEAYKELIIENIDQIDYYLELIDISIILDNNSEKQLTVDQKQCSYHYISSVMVLIEDSIKKGTNGSVKNSNSKPIQRQRGPYLAKMILFDVLNKRQQTQADVDHLLKQMANSIVDLLFEYFVEFGSKQACIYDIFYILDKTTLTETEIKSLTLQMKQLILNISEDDIDINSMHRHMCYYYVCHYTGEHDCLNRENRIKLVQNLTEKYENYYKNIVVKSDLTPTEPQPTDPYVILMADILFKADNELDDKIISETIVILETALIRSPANFHIKLLLIRLYNMLGAVGASYTLWESLDIKHMQYDSIGYLFIDPLISCAHFSISSQMIANALKFYSTNSKDTLDYLISCYKFGSFNKVEEILNLRNRLNNSLQFCLFATDSSILDMILETKNHSSTENLLNTMEIDCEKDKFVWNDICDNRDFSVVRSHHQKSEQSMREKQLQTFNDQILWLKIRNLMIRAIAASHNLISEYVNKNKFINNNRNSNKINETNGTENGDNIDILSQISLKFRESIETLENSFIGDSEVSLDGPNASRIVGFSKTNHFEVILTLIDFIILVNNETKENWFSIDVKSGDIFAQIVDELEMCVQKNKKNLLSIRSTLEQLTNCVETLSISIIFIGICQSIMKYKMNIISNKKIRRKKESSGTVDSINDSLVKIYSSLVSKFEESVERIDKVIKTNDIFSIFSDAFNSTLNENESNLSSIREKVNKSYNQSIKELSDLLQNKLFYLHSLRL